MRSTSSRIRRGLPVTLVLVAVAAAVLRRSAPAGRHAELLPPVGGDTWPPVPVKDVGTA